MGHARNVSNMRQINRQMCRHDIGASFRRLFSTTVADTTAPRPRLRPSREDELIQHVLATTQRGDVDAILRAVDTQCASPENWMMHLGPLKWKVL